MGNLTADPSGKFLYFLTNGGVSFLNKTDLLVRLLSIL